MGKIASLMAAAALAAAAPAHAEALSGVEAGLSLQRYKIDLDADGAEIEHEISRLGFALWESAGPVLLGLEIGPLLVTQDDNPATAGMDLTGYFIGFSASGAIPLGKRLELQLGGHLGYNDVEDDRRDQDTELRWYEARAQAAAVLRLSPVHLSAGAYALYIDGEETASGALTYSRDFEAEDAAGAFLAADYWVDPTGRISLRAEGGARRGVELLFSRRF